MKRKTDELPRRRAEVILQVRSGRITAIEGATLLGISRKTYYQWEQRALKAMLQALTDGSPGRPPRPKPDPETLRLGKQVSQLQNRLDLVEGVHELRLMLAELRPPNPPPPAPSQSKTNRKTNRRTPKPAPEKKR